MLTLDDSNRARDTAAHAGATMLMIKPFGPTLMSALSAFLPIDPAHLEEIELDAASAVRAGALTLITRMRSCVSSGDPA